MAHVQVILCNNVHDKRPIKIKRKITENLFFLRLSVILVLLLPSLLSLFAFIQDHSSSKHSEI